MSVNSLIRKLTNVKQTTTDVYVVVQPSALFFSASSELSLPEQVPINHASWQQTLCDVLQQANATNIAIKVVLHANIYQTFQIDKPNVPEEELKSTLPFLVKDLINEKVTNIVTDSTPLAINNKLQVYVVQRSLIVELSEMLSKIKVELLSVLVEDEIWGRSAADVATFLLLQRSKQGSFRISAFSDHQCAFQRSVRGIVAPLTGVASSSLQLDSLALELQRSIDYLSSQMRGAQLHQLYVCCDEEQQQELIENLNESLSVKVAALSDSEQESGLVLADNVNKLEHSDINLFPQDLKPSKERFTLQNVALAWLVSLLVLVGVFAGLKFQSHQIQQSLQAYQSQQEEFSRQAASLNQRLAQHKPSAEKAAAIKRLKLEVEAKRNSLQSLDHIDESQQLGYSGVMRSLAELGRNDISLSSIVISDNQLDLKGFARDPQSVPNWINQFQNELNLVGRTFQKLKIGRNEQNVVSFELITTTQPEEN